MSDQNPGGKKGQGSAKVFGVDESARRQIDVMNSKDEAMLRHDAHWEMINRRLGAQALAAPHPPGVVPSVATPRDRYEQAREAWETQREEISNVFDEQYAVERGLGVTASENFRSQAGPRTDEGERLQKPEIETVTHADHQADEREAVRHDAQERECTLERDFSAARGNVSRGRGI